MAGQPPDRPWQPASPNGQDQVRTAWQPPPPFEQSARESYPPPPQPQQRPSYQQGGAGYGAEQEDQHTLAWEQPSHPGPQADWQSPRGNAGHQGPQARAAAHTKGFVASLFDFGFTSFVTPKVVKGLYALAALWVILEAIFFLLVSIHFGGVNAGTIIFALVGIAVFGLLSLGTIRVLLEFFMVLFRINENVQVLRDRGDEK